MWYADASNFTSLKNATMRPRNLREALRKHILRVDLHVHCGEEGDYNNDNDLTSAIKSVLNSAIIKGLDIVGVTAAGGPSIGLRAGKLVRENGLDLFVIPGEEYRTADGFNLLVFNVGERIPINQGMEQVCQWAHGKRGFVVAVLPSKRQVSKLNKLKGSPTCPDAVEIYNAASGGYMDTQVELPAFISSAVTTAKEMEERNAYSLVNRPTLEGMGLLPENYGVDYTPQYLQRADEQDAAAAAAATSPQAVV